MAITITPQTANQMDLASVRQLIGLQARCPASVGLNINYQQDAYLISYSFRGTDERYVSRSTCLEVIDACELIIEVITTLKEDVL